MKTETSTMVLYQKPESVSVPIMVKEAILYGSNYGDDWEDQGDD